MIEPTLSRETIYEGNIISVFKDRVQLPDGREGIREIVDHQPAVVIIAIDNHHVYFVRQYRKAIQDYLLELPAGCVESGEDMLEAAKRELQEECGCCADSWTQSMSLFPTPGFCNEIYHFFIAKQLTFTTQSLDADEFVTVESMSFDEYEKNVHSHQFKDVKTVLGFYLLKDHLK